MCLDILTGSACHRSDDHQSGKHHYDQRETKSADDYAIDDYSRRVVGAFLTVVTFAASAAFYMREQTRPDDAAPPGEAELLRISAAAERARCVLRHVIHKNYLVARSKKQVVRRLHDSFRFEAGRFASCFWLLATDFQPLCFLSSANPRSRYPSLLRRRKRTQSNTARHLRRRSLSAEHLAADVP